MSQKERYIEDVLERIFSTPEEQRRLENDLRAHFSDGEEAGESEAAIIRRLGPQEDVAASFMRGEEARFAGFWIRALAFLTDVAALASASLPIFCGLMLLLRASAPPWSTTVLESDAGPDGWVAFMSIFVFAVGLCGVGIGIGLWIFYFPVLEHVYGKTLGKHLLGLRVLTEQKTRVGLGCAFLRRLSLYFEFFMFDALFVPFTKRRQRAFDIVAHTVVVREGEVSPVSFFLCFAILFSPLLFLIPLIFLSASVG